MVSELSTVPLLLDAKSKKDEKQIEKLIKKVGAEAADQASFNREDYQKKAFFGKLIEIGILALALSIVVVVIAGLLMSDRLSM